MKHSRPVFSAFHQTKYYTSTRSNSTNINGQSLGTTSTTNPPLIRPYKHETSLSLANSLAVFQMCGVPLLVKHFPNFVKFSKLTKTDALLNAVVKRTFFKHFCGVSLECVTTNNTFHNRRGRFKRSSSYNGQIGQGFSLQDLYRLISYLV